MNIENLARLRDWLLDGAPHVAFHMNEGIGKLEWANNGRYEPYEIPPGEFEKPGVGGCGTVCCIGGAAAQMAWGTLGLPFAEQLHNDWEEDVCPTALDFLGLHQDFDYFFGNPLFDPELAPMACTPQQAAAAVQRVMDGKFPWPGAEE